MKNKIIWFILFSQVVTLSFSQIELDQLKKNTRDNVPVDDSLVRSKLEIWQDLKFDLFMHWGAYSQWGIVESWSLCSEGRDFIKENRPEVIYPDYDQYKGEYKNLQKTFTPTGFNPEKWAEAAKDAGMKYVVFTTKYHDGFCMFDTQETDYKITSQKCPFHIHPYADIAEAVFNTFRKENFINADILSESETYKICLPTFDIRYLSIIKNRLI